MEVKKVLKMERSEGVMMVMMSMIRMEVKMVKEQKELMMGYRMGR